MNIKLKNSTASCIVETFGAQLTSFCTEKGKELLWQGDPKFWSGQAPVLFPIVGAMRENKGIIENNWYEMPQHGFARHMEFEVLENTEDKLCLGLKANEKTLSQYPYSFLFKVTYTLCEKGLETAFYVENTGDIPMYFAVGGHPGFNVPIEDNESFEDYRLEFEMEENQVCPQIDMAQRLIDFPKKKLKLENEKVIPLSRELFANDALVFENLNSNRVRLISGKSGRGVEMDFKGFPMLGVWSPSGNGPMVALEPWMGCATGTDESDDFTEKRHMCCLQPGESKALAFTVYYI